MNELLWIHANPNATDFKGCTTLILGCGQGHLATVRCILDAGAKQVPATTEFLRQRFGGKWFSPFRAAHRLGFIEVLHFLCDAGRWETNRAAISSLTPVYVASSRGHLAVVRLLCGAGADANATFPDVTAALCVASFHGHVEVVRFLYNACGNKIVAGTDGSTPLNVASRKGHLEVVRFLCDAGADKNHADRNGRTPLCNASCLDHLEVVRFLCNARADANQATDDGRTPLEIVCTQVHFSVACVLRNAGAVLRPVNSGVKRQRQDECAGCRNKLRLPAFVSDRLRIRRRNNDITQHAKCKACRAIPYPEVKCVGCRETLPWSCFNAVRLVRWQRN